MKHYNFFPQNENGEKILSDDQIFEIIGQLENQGSIPYIPIENNNIGDLNIESYLTGHFVTTKTARRIGGQYLAGDGHIYYEMMEHYIRRYAATANVPDDYSEYLKSVFELAAYNGYPSLDDYFRDKGTNNDYHALDYFSPARIFQLGRYLSTVGLQLWDVRKKYITDSLNNSIYMPSQRNQRIFNAYYGSAPTRRRDSVINGLNYIPNFISPPRYDANLPLKKINANSLKIMQRFIQSDINLWQSWSLKWPDIPYIEIADHIDYIYDGKITGRKIMKYSQDTDFS